MQGAVDQSEVQIEHDLQVTLFIRHSNDLIALASWALVGAKGEQMSQFSLLFKNCLEYLLVWPADGGSQERVRELRLAKGSG